ncbi:MAG TPA: glycosyltransferase family 2 protein [Usitatibacter sp.]|nr:glycosyltransferase family 2 protein [Usitatibacter sp.]
MLNGRRIAVVMPAYKAERTLRRTFDGLPHDIVDQVILTDDASGDATATLARSLGIHTIVHDRNRGYGANQKTCYLEALRLGADVVVMVHPDYQYEPRLVTPMASMITSGVYDLVLGSRILGGTAMSGGMPAWKYVANRLLTAAENFALGSKLSEFHTGFRAYSREALLTIPLLANSDDFVFDNQLLAQAVAAKLRIGEISCPTSYHGDASSINFSRSVKYGLGVLGTSATFLAWRMGLASPRIFSDRAEDRLSSQLAAT